MACVKNNAPSSFSFRVCSAHQHTILGNYKVWLDIINVEMNGQPIGLQSMLRQITRGWAEGIVAALM